MIDTLTGYFHAMPQDALLLPQMHELMSYTARRGVLSILVVAQHGVVGGDAGAPVDVSYVADAVILLRQESEDLRVLLFQVVRELLFNVKKHAGTDRAVVTLWQDEHYLVVEVADDGCGFHPGKLQQAKQARGFGLYSVQERLRLFGGHVEVESRPGDGTRVRVHAPATPKKPAETRS